MPKIILGYAQAMDGETLIANTTTDEMVTIHIKDRDKRWDLYCSHLKITVEKITEKKFHEELKKINRE